MNKLFTLIAVSSFIFIAGAGAQITIEVPEAPKVNAPDIVGKIKDEKNRAARQAQAVKKRKQIAEQKAKAELKRKEREQKVALKAEKNRAEHEKLKLAQAKKKGKAKVDGSVKATQDQVNDELKRAQETKIELKRKPAKAK